jgi:hypothetical protein
MELLNEKYKDKVLGTIGCFDRVIVMGTLPGLCYPQGMTCGKVTGEKTPPSQVCRGPLHGI